MRTMRRNIAKAIVILIVSFLIIGAALFAVDRLSPSALAEGAGDPQPATVAGIRVLPWYTAGAAISSTTYYYGPDGSPGTDLLYFNSYDLFVTADIVTGTQTITFTAQCSADGSNFADVDYRSEGWALPLNNTIGITSTGVTTVTFASMAAERTSEQIAYSLSFSADGTDMIKVPMCGQYVRIKAEVLTSTYTVIPTIYAVAKNRQ